MVLLADSSKMWQTIARSVQSARKQTRKGRGECRWCQYLLSMQEPFERIAMDIVGPLTRSCNGNRYILVACDYATRFPEAILYGVLMQRLHVAQELAHHRILQIWNSRGDTFKPMI